MQPNDTILVTGAAGFIGGRVTEALCLGHMANARAGIRRWSGASRIARFPVEIVLCDVLNKKQVRQGMRGVKYVVHSAMGDALTNIQGTRNLLEAAMQMGVKRFIHLSTAEVYGNEVTGTVDEKYPCKQSGWEYADSKIEAEELCWKYQARGLPVTLLRPSIVYGPFSKTWTVRMANRLQSGNWYYFNDRGEGICNLVYVDDLVSAILLAIDEEDAAGEAFNVNGPEAVSWNQYFSRFNAAMRLPELQTIGPASAVLEAAAIDFVRAVSTSSKGILGSARFGHMTVAGRRSNVIRRVMRQARERVRTSPNLRELRHTYGRNALYDLSKARNLLGYAPKFDLDAGLKMSVRWLDHHGFLN